MFSTHKFATKLIILVDPTFCEENPEDRNLLFALQDYAQLWDTVF